MIVGWRHTLDAKVREQVEGIPFRVRDAIAQILGVGVSQWTKANRIEDSLKSWDVRLCRGEGKRSILSALIYATAAREEPGERVAEAQSLQILFVFWHERDAICDLIGCTNQVRQACLPSCRVDGVVCGVAVGDQIAGKCAAEDRNCDL